jgi:hypothetical protein
VYQVEQLKSKNFIVYNKKYRFKEDWVLQAFILKKQKAFEWIQYLDELYTNEVRVIRESYLCPIDHVYRGPAGLKLEFYTKQSAEDYCKKLNEVAYG